MFYVPIFQISFHTSKSCYLWKMTNILLAPKLVITTSPIMQSSSLNLGYPQCLLGNEVFLSPTWQTRYCSPTSQKVAFNNKACDKPSIPWEEIGFVLATSEAGTNNSSASLRGRHHAVTSLPGAAAPANLPLSCSREPGWAAEHWL